MFWNRARRPLCRRILIADARPIRLAGARRVPPGGASAADALAGQYGKGWDAAYAALGFGRHRGGGSRGDLGVLAAGQTADERFHSPTAGRGGRAAKGRMCRGKLGAIVSRGRIG